MVKVKLNSDLFGNGSKIRLQNLIYYESKYGVVLTDGHSDIEGNIEFEVSEENRDAFVSEVKGSYGL